MNNLPEYKTGFVGRETEISEIIEELRTSGWQILSLVGPGGTGKTRTLIEAIVRTDLKYRNGILFVNLNGITERDVVIKSIQNLVIQQSSLDESITGFDQAISLITFLND